ncbi:MAG: family 16 glycosylhydrolase [Treponema sp.]|nr:family 16 glycosylhydrolase [Treponema sp.]
MKKSLGLLMGLVLALSMLTGCNNISAAQAETDETSGARYVQNWGLWDALDYYNTGTFNKANWTNGGMFNCGWNPNNVYFQNGKMVIKLNNQWSHGKPYSSGEYRTNNTFSYGTFETNMIAAKGDGLVTSFFLYTGNPWDEIDVEILGKDTTKVQFNYYVDGVANNEKIIDLGFDASQGYHKYAIEYGNGYINWYVDGKWKWGVNNAGFNAPYGKKMPSHPMQIMVNLWPGTGVDSWLNHFNYWGEKYAYYDYIKYTPK